MAAGEFSTSGSITEATARGIAKVFRDLTVYGDPKVLDALIPAIESRLADGWSRDHECEQRLPGDRQSTILLFRVPRERRAAGGRTGNVRRRVSAQRD